MGRRARLIIVGGLLAVAAGTAAFGAWCWSDWRRFEAQAQAEAGTIDALRAAAARLPLSLEERQRLERALLVVGGARAFAAENRRDTVLSFGLALAALLAAGLAARRLR